MHTKPMYTRHATEALTSSNVERVSQMQYRRLVIFELFNAFITEPFIH